MDTLKQIQQFFKGEIRTDSSTLRNFSRDASLFFVYPKLVVFPKDVADLQNLVKFVSGERSEGHNLSLTARSAGTDMSGGPLSESIVVSLTEHFNRMGQITKNDAVTEPGVFYRDFERATLKRNLLMPAFPASRELCTVGGMVANNSGGELTLTYGKTENYVSQIKMVLADGKEAVFKPQTLAQLMVKKKTAGLEGRIYREMFELIDQNYDLLQKAKPKVSKNSAGYYLWNVYDRATGIFDLTKLIVGSQGTLGLITEIKFKLVRPKTHTCLLVIFLKDFQALPKVVNHVLKFQPQSFESFDDHTLKLALKILPDFIGRLKGNAVKLFLQFLPEMWMALTGGMPKLIALAEFAADSHEEAIRQAIEAQESLVPLKLKTKLIKKASAAQKYWTIRRESFNLLRHHVKDMRTAPFIDDFVVRPEFLPKFLPRLYKILDRSNLLYTVAGHIGDGNFHIIPLMNQHEPNAAEIIRKISDEVFRLVLEYHGTITGEHNDGLIRTPYLRQMYGDEVYQLFLKTKHIFDPLNIFNPGKKVKASLTYALDHLDF